MKTGIYWQDPKCAVGRCRTDPGCVLYLPLHSLDGASFMSKDAYGHLCTVTGALWTPRGRSFDGLDDDIDCGDIGYLTQFTIEAWINTDTQSGADGIVCQDPSGDRAIRFTLDAGRLSLTTYETSGGIVLDFGETSISMNTGAWYHVVATYAGGGGTAYLFIDGLEVKSGAISGTIHHSAGGWLIGKDEVAAGRVFDGLIGEVRVYNRVLTPLEIRHNYLATKWRYQ